MAVTRDRDVGGRETGTPRCRTPRRSVFVGALAMLDGHLEGHEGITPGADAGHDTTAFVEALRERGATPLITSPSAWLAA
jgi:hypothetical protein